MAPSSSRLGRRWFSHQRSQPLERLSYRLVWNVRLQAACQQTLEAHQTDCSPLIEAS